nr:MAG TPA: minor tail protein [Caudoviricetes sp.]
MADNVFRVEVGAKIGASTATLKKDIQDILDKMPARKIEVSINTAKSKQNIKAELDKLKGKYSIPVELSAKGTGLNGTSGKNFQAAIKTITNEINAQQAAKITLHIDTAATQKAMLVELKKLNLGVTITPGNGNNGGGKQVDEYVKAWKQVAQLQASANAKFAKRVPLDATSNQYQVLQTQGQRIMQQAQQIRDAYLQTADAQQRGITQANFDAMVAGNKKVQDSVDKLTEAQAKYNDAQVKAQQAATHRTGQIDEKQLDQARKLSANVDNLKQKLNQSVPVAVQYSQQLDMLEDAYYAGAIDIDQYNQALGRWETAAGKAGAMAESAGQKFSRMLGDKIGYGAIALVLMKIRQALGQVYTNVVNLDTAMTELKKVTDETDETYQKFLTNAASRARALGATITDTVNATASFARLGYGIEDASKLADAAVVYKHVGDEIESIDEASNSVISTMQAFGVEASNVMSIVDKFNQIGNKFAISSGGVGEAMQRSAAAMQAAGNTIDETLALIAAMNTVVQNPEAVGTTLKTVSMYLRAAKTEAEAAGEATDGMADSVSKLRDEIKSLTGNKVDIMLDEDTFKSSYQILKELSQIWDQLSDVSQANILEKLAGKRNANALVAVINNFDIAEQALKESQKSAGSALQENEKYLDSINGKSDKLKASWEQISNRLLSNGVVKGLIDALRTVLDFFNRLDEATGGWSSRLIAFFAVVGMVNAVISSFKFKAKDATSLLGNLVQAFSKGNILTAFGSSLATVGTKLKDVAAAFQLAAGAGAAKFLPTLWSLIPAMGQTALIVTAVVAAIGGISYAVKKIREANPTLSDLQKEFNASKERADELKASLDSNNERLTELKDKLADGGLTFVEQDELEKLQATTDQLQAQYDIAAKIADLNESKVTAKTADEAGFYLNEQDTYEGFSGTLTHETDYHKAQKALEDYKTAEKNYNDELLKDNPNIAKVNKYKQEMDDANSVISEASTLVDNYLSELNKEPETYADIISQLNQFRNQIYLTIGGAEALSTLWNRFWNDETSHPGVEQTRKDLEAAATAQKEFNDELKRYQSNVDMTNRPHITVTQDMVNTGMWDKSDIGMYSTVNSQTFTASDFGSNSTQAILVTPILPDGTYFKSQQDLEDYLATLIDGSGKFDVTKDTKGIVMGIFDKGSVDESVQEADQYAEAAHEVNAAFDTLLESDVFQQFRSEMEAAGYDMDNLSAGDLAKMFEQLPSAVDPATESLTGLTTALSALEAKASLIKSAQEELSSSGSLSVSTLSSIVEKFPALEEDVSLYIAGMKTGKELISDLSAAYQSDTEAYKANLAKKLAASPEFFKNLTSDQKQLISDLADSYDVDLGNFKTVEQAKLNFQAEIIKKLAMNYKEYSGASLATLKRSRTDLQTMVAHAKNNPIYTDEQRSTFQARLNEVNSAIAAIEDGNARLDSLINTNLEGWAPSKYSDKSSNKSGNKEDLHKKAAEEAIAKLKHDYQIEKITAKQYYDGLEAIENRYYKNSTANRKTYASEIRSIDEELFSGRRQLAEDWLSDQEKLADKASTAGDYAGQQKILNSMLDKVKKMMSDAYVYGLTEASDYVQELQDKLSTLQDDLLSAVQSPYEKYISYMDDFDLWDDIAKTGDAFSSMAGSIDQASSAVAKLSKQLRGLSKLDVLKQQLKDIDQLYKDGKLSWEKYVDAHNNVAKDIYDTQKNSLQTILDLTMEMIKQEAEDQVDAIEKQVDAYQKIIDLKKQLLQDSADEEDHEEQVAEKVKEIADLQSKIAQLSLDDSREAAAKRASLAEELQQKQKELADLQKDYALDQTIDTLDKSQEAFEDEKDAEKDAAKESVDSWQKLYEKAIKRINGDWDGLYKDLLKYEQEHRDSIDGPDSLVSAWHSATSAMKEYNNSFEDAYKNAPNDALNPNAPNSSEAQSILEQMQSNSAYALLHPGSGLSKKNAQLAEEYYQQTGQKLYYNSSIGWVKDSPTSTTAAYEILGSNAKANPYSAGTAKYRDTNSSAVKWIQYQLKAAGYSQPIDGNYWDTTAKNVAAFANKYKLRSNNGKEVTPSILKYLKAYHTGGIVGNGGELNDHEVLAILKKGEWVLDDTRKQNLKELFANLKIAASGLMSSAVMSRMQTMRPAMVASGGDTFAPHIEVSIQHNGQMTDKDAKQYGNMVANTALEQLRTAFAKRGKV